MAKGKPDLTGISADALAWAEQAEAPVATAPLETPQPGNLPANTETPPEVPTVLKFSVTNPETRIVTGVRLLPADLNKLRQLAFIRQQMTGKRTTLQSILEVAVIEYLERETKGWQG